MFFVDNTELRGYLYNCLYSVRPVRKAPTLPSSLLIQFDHTTNVDNTSKLEKWPCLGLDFDVKRRPVCVLDQYGHLKAETRLFYTYEGFALNQGKEPFLD